VLIGLRLEEEQGQDIVKSLIETDDETDISYHTLASELNLWIPYKLRTSDSSIPKSRLSSML
jgi:hypothetical protein